MLPILAKRYPVSFPIMPTPQSIMPTPQSILLLRTVFQFTLILERPFSLTMATPWRNIQLSRCCRVAKTSMGSPFWSEDLMTQYQHRFKIWPSHRVEKVRHSDITTGLRNQVQREFEYLLLPSKNMHIEVRGWALSLGEIA